jgi:hypothetical protein
VYKHVNSFIYSEQTQKMSWEDIPAFETYENYEYIRVEQA